MATIAAALLLAPDLVQSELEQLHDALDDAIGEVIDELMDRSGDLPTVLGRHHRSPPTTWACACAGVTLNAVSTALGLKVRGATVKAEGDLDFRGTLGVAKDAPVGFRDIRLTFDIDGDLTEEERANLLKLTERYCVVYQTLKSSPPIAVELRA